MPALALGAHGQLVVWKLLGCLDLLEALGEPLAALLYLLVGEIPADAPDGVLRVVGLVLGVALLVILEQRNDLAAMGVEAYLPKHPAVDEGLLAPVPKLLVILCAEDGLPSRCRLVVRDGARRIVVEVEYAAQLVAVGHVDDEVVLLELGLGLLGVLENLVHRRAEDGPHHVRHVLSDLVVVAALKDGLALGRVLVVALRSRDERAREVKGVGEVHA